MFFIYLFRTGINVIPVRRLSAVRGYIVMYVTILIYVTAATRWVRLSLDMKLITKSSNSHKSDVSNAYVIICTISEEPAYNYSYKYEIFIYSVGKPIFKLIALTRKSKFP